MSDVYLRVQGTFKGNKAGAKGLVEGGSEGGWEGRLTRCHLEDLETSTGGWEMGDSTAWGELIYLGRADPYFLLFCGLSTYWFGVSFPPVTRYVRS